MESKLPIQITEKTFIKKYAEGVDVTTAEPFEIVEGPNKIYKGQEAINRLIELGYDPAQIIKQEV
jgi:hypothetical protein